ncbi:MAG: hypothetical protein NTW28_19645, partial [Candidatus Solibacter sp.]|nr:hypothetical protein [Candidatus Solibacter sp.]
PKLSVIYLEGGGQRDATAWNEIRQSQSVKWVLAGTTFRSGGRLRINATLMDPKTRRVQWANFYDGGEGDVLALESTLAEDIANAIQVSITARDRERLRQRSAPKPEALDAYRLG